MLYLLQWVGAGMAGLSSALSLVVIANYKTLFNFTIITLLIVVFLFVLHRFFSDPDAEYRTLLPSITTYLAGVGFLSITEWLFLKIFLFFLILAAQAWLFTLARPVRALTPHEHKMTRRLLTMLCTFNCYAIVTALFAFAIFFPNWPFWLLALCGGVVYSLAAHYIWRLYYEISWRGSALWLLTVGYIMVEVIWVLHVLPFDYGTSGFFTTWFWFLMQQLIRYHLSPLGVVWKKQRIFLSLNLLVALAILIFFVRWV